MNLSFSSRVLSQEANTSVYFDMLPSWKMYALRALTQSTSVEPRPWKIIWEKRRSACHACSVATISGAVAGSLESTCQTAQMSMAHWTSSSRSSRIWSSWGSKTPKPLVTLPCCFRTPSWTTSTSTTLAESYWVAVPQSLQHHGIWGFSSSTESYKVAVPQSLQHNGVWGFSSFTASYPVERFQQHWSLQH